VDITEFINKEDLQDPYDRLSEFLTFADIIRLEQKFKGKQRKFRKKCTDVADEYPELIELVGLDKAWKIIEELGGTGDVYFPELKRNCLNKIKSLIISECNGYNYSKLADKFGYTERHIRNITSGKIKKQPQRDENQLSIFDFKQPSTL